MKNKDDKIFVNNKIYSIQKFLGKGKSGYSYLAFCEDKLVVLKIIHHEPCAYYTFQNKIESEITAYKKLKTCNILIPELIDIDYNQEIIVKEFINGKIASELIAENNLSDEILVQLFLMSRNAKQNLLNIDFFPNNFVIFQEDLYYIDYEVNPYSDEWNLTNWGIYYWANSMGMKLFLKTGNHLEINCNENSGIPIKEPFEKTVTLWIQKFNFSI